MLCKRWELGSKQLNTVDGLWRIWYPITTVAVVAEEADEVVEAENLEKADHKPNVDGESKEFVKTHEPLPGRNLSIIDTMLIACQRSDMYPLAYRITKN